MHPITKALGISVPILQAPIGSAACPELAAAVSEAGGLGSLALTWASPADARLLVRQVRERTARSFQVNFVLAFPCAALLAALDAGAPVVTFSWGIPKEHADLVRSFGAKFGVQVSTRDGARRALDAGAEFLICQGGEAGGHVQATRSLWRILEPICDEAGATAVFAAGGLAVGADLARAMSLGAAGGMLGTRFVASIESAAHATYKQLLVEANAADTVLTVCFDLGWPQAAHRVLRNKTLDDWESAGCPPRGRRPGEGDILVNRPDGRPVRRFEDTLPLEGMSGTIAELCLYAGTGVGAIHDIALAAELVERLWAECRHVLELGHHA